MNNTVKSISWLLFFVVLIITLGFVADIKGDQVCKNVEIHIDHVDENYFIDEKDVLSMLPFDLKMMDSIPISEVQADIIEKRLNNHPAIYNAEVYQELDGDLKIEVHQRKPIARIYNSHNESFYLDNYGNLMPLSNKFTARVLVISGHLDSKYDKWYRVNLGELQKEDSLARKTLLDEVNTLASYIHENPFWRAQIEHLYVNKDSEVELIPRVGNHTIVFGDIEHLDEKFEKLELFYREGLSKTGWNEYSKINLKFKDQVVCTKRYLH